jgi:phage tail P2-like protein
VTLGTLDFLRLLPVFMRGDGAARGLAAALDRVVPSFAERAHALSTWDVIDVLPESELDELAWELYITWYDSGADIETKRELIRSSYLVRARFGTPWAVEEFARAHFGNGVVSEWFEYGGEPFFFRLYVVVDPRADYGVGRRRLLDGLWRVKNVRSHLDEAFFTSETPQGAALFAAAAPGARHSSTALPLFWPDGHFAAAAHMGAAGARAGSTALPGGAAGGAAGGLLEVGGDVLPGLLDGPAGVLSLQLDF